MAHSSSLFQNFLQTYCQLLGSAAVQEDATRIFNEYLVCPTAGSIDAFIRRAGTFRAKHAKLIQAMADTMGHHLSQGDIATLTQKFVDDPTYSIDSLQADIESNIIPDNDTTKEATKESSTKESASDVVFVDGRDLTPTTAEPVKRPTLDHAYLEAFEKEFNRAMFVQEYFAYQDVKEYTVDFKELHAKFDETYVAARQIYLDYTDKGLSMHEFVKKHLSEFQDDAFIQGLANSCLTSLEYADCMSERLRRLGKSMYDEVLTQEDIGYLLTRVRGQRLALTDERIRSILADYCIESTLLAERVETCFQEILHRAPEQEELSHWVLEFRRMSEKKTDEPLRVLARFLISSLEFHDVIKTMLGTCWLQLGKTVDMGARRRFAALNKVLQRIDDACDSMELVKGYIQEAINEIQ